MRIDWTEQAATDLQSIYDYIAQDSENYATEYIAALFEAVEHLSRFPLSGRKLPSSAEQTLREIIFRNHHVIYRVLDDRIRVLTVVHGRRNSSLW